MQRIKQQSSKEYAAEQAHAHEEAQKRKQNAQKFAQKYEAQQENAEKHVNKERRRFLDMIAKAGVSTPLLKASSLLGGVFASRYAMAAGGPKRVVYCYLDSGADDSSWMPSSATSMNTVTQPYGPSGEDVAGICNFRQVNVHLSGHSAAFQSLGVQTHGQPTIDARIAPILSATTPYTSMYLGSGATSNGSLCSTIGPCTDDPAGAYQRYFNSSLPTGSTDDTYKKVYQSHARAIQAVKTKLGQDERERLEAHEAAVERIESRIEAVMSSEGPDLDSFKPTMPSPGSYTGKIVATGKLQADIMLAGLQAGITNVGILQLGNHQGNWTGDGTSYTGNLHDSAHSAPGNTAFNEMIRHLSEVPAYFIRRLMDEEDADGQKMIDSTVFVQVTCMGNGITHEPANAPFLVATRMSGFNGGFSTMTRGFTEDLHGAVARGLGIPDSAYAAMGNDDLGLV